MSRRFYTESPSAVVRDAILIALGSLVTAAGLNLFIIPNRLADGGLTGLAILLYDLWHLPVGPVLFLLNVPLFAASAWILGLRFALRTVLGIVLISLALTLVPLHPVVHIPLLAAVYGGLLSGTGVGLIFRVGGSTGGTDLIARLVRHYTGLPMSTGLMAADVIVVAVFGLVMGAIAAMYSLIALFVGTRVVDFLIDGLEVRRAALIISNEPDAIGGAILEDLGRGVTALHATGLYSGSDRPVLLVVVSRLETVRLKAIVARIDPRAFVVIHHVHEVLGEGFRQIESHGPPPGVAPRLRPGGRGSRK